MWLGERRAVEGAIATGEESGWLDVAGASMRAAWYVDNTNARQVAIEEAYERRIDAVFKATGQRLVNPGRELLRDEIGENSLLGTAPWSDDPDESLRRRAGEFDAELARLAKERPDLAEIIRPDVSPLEEARATAREAYQKSAETLESYRGPWGTGTVAQFAGALAGSLSDPAQWAAMVLGPLGRAKEGIKGLLWMGVKQGAANAAIETALQPTVAAWRKEAGIGYGATDFALNVGTAFVAGFGLDTTIRGAARGVRRLRGDVPVLDEKGGVRGWESKEAALDRAAAKSKAETVVKALEGDAAATRALARELGLDKDPEFAAALEMAEDGDATATLRPGVDPDEDAAAASQAVRHLLDPAEPPPVPPEPRPLMLYRAEGSETFTTDIAEAAAEGRAVDRVVVPAEKVADVRADDAGGLSVPAGLTPEPLPLPVALANHRLRDGRLTAVEAAEIMRDLPDAADGSVSMGSLVMRQARAMTRLSDAAFRMVQQGETEVHLAALVGDLVRDRTRHAATLAAVTRLAPKTIAGARRAIAMLAAERSRMPPFEARQMADPFGADADRQIADLERTLGVPAKEETAKAAEGAAPRLPGTSDVVVPVFPAEAARAGEARRITDLFEREGLGGIRAFLERLSDADRGEVAARLLADKPRLLREGKPDEVIKLLAARALREVARDADPERRTRLHDLAARVEAAERSGVTAPEPLMERQVAHPRYAQLKLPANADGSVTVYRGEKRGQEMKGFTHRMFTTDLQRARAFAGSDGMVREVRVPAARLGEMVPRSSSRDRPDAVKPGQSMFTLPEDLAVGARLEGGIVARALEDAVDNALVRGLDEADALARMKALIEECKL